MLAGAIPLVVDEAYLLAVTGNFQLSFFDHPPLAFWIITGLQALFGPELSPLILRLPFIALGTGSVWLVFRLTARLWDEWAGAWAAFLFAVAPFFLASSGSWLVPDGPLVFFLLLSGDLLARIYFDKRGGWGIWIALGIAFGLALLSKYHALLFLLGAGAFLIATTDGRAWLRRAEPWAALAVSAIVFLPVLVWNAANGWVSFVFQFSRAGAETRFNPINFLIGLAGEGAYLLPWTLIGLIAVLLIGLVRRGDSRTWFLLALGLPSILAFNGLALAGRTILFHWPMPGWLFLFPLLGAWVTDWRRAALWARNGFAFLSVLTVLVVAGLALALAGDFRPLTGSPNFRWIVQSTLSWHGLRAPLETAMAAQGSPPFVASNSWIDGALAHAAIRPAEPVAVLSEERRGFAYVLDQKTLIGRDALIVTRSTQTAGVLARLAGRFASFEPVASVGVPRPDEPVLTLDITLAREFLRPFD